MPAIDNAERYQTEYRHGAEAGAGDTFGGAAGKENREGAELGAGKGDDAKGRPGDLKESNLSLASASPKDGGSDREDKKDSGNVGGGGGGGARWQEHEASRMARMTAEHKKMQEISPHSSAKQSKGH